jgi:hypothetical protein
VRWLREGGMVKEWLGGWNGEGAWEGDREKGRVGGMMEGG